LTADEARAAGFAGVYPLTGLEPDLERCQREARTLLTALARRFAETSPLLAGGGAGGPGRSPVDSAGGASADAAHPG
jgi:hypothetical protein